jgi:hypothetical protein
MHNIQDTIMKKIVAGELQMRPRWHFLLRTALLVSGMVVAALLSIYLLSFVLFALRDTGIIFSPGFGLPGIWLFLIATPWLLIFVVGVFLLILYVLITHFSFSYTRPHIYSLLGVVLFVIAMSSFIQLTMMHHYLQDFAFRHEVPGMSPFYRVHLEGRPEGVLQGRIRLIGEGEFVIGVAQGGDVLVKIDSRTKLPKTHQLVVGDYVIVFGPKLDSYVQAFGVKRSEEFRNQSQNPSRISPYIE